MSTERLTADLEELLPDTLEHLRTWVDVNSWTLNPAGVNEVGRLTAEAFAPLGFMAEAVPSTDPRYGHHLVLTRPGLGPVSVLLVSHLDTVFPPDEEERNKFHWRPEGDRIYGPGTHDIKGGTALAWLTLQGLRLHEPEVFVRTTWRLCLNSSEEVLSGDFARVCTQRIDAGTRAALVFEAEGRKDGVRRLVVARKGRGSWRVSVSGRGAHAGVKHAHGANAAVQLARLIDQIAGFTDYHRELTFNVGTVQAGSGLNRVPETAVAEGEFRAFTGEAYELGRSQLLELAGDGDVASLVDGFACRIGVELTSETAPWPRNDATDALFGIWSEVAQELGEPLVSESRGGLSDGNQLWAAVPTLDGLGPAGDHDHCSERSEDASKLPEYVDRTSFVPKAVLNVRAIGRLLSRVGLADSGNPSSGLGVKYGSIDSANC